MPSERRWRRRIAWALATLALLLVAALFVARRLRPTYKPPVAVADGVFRVRNFFTEIYGARAGGKIVLFDAGLDPEGGAVDALLAALGGSCADVSDVWLSHGHFDHVAAAPHCPSVRIHVGAADVDLLAHRVETEPAAARWLERVFPVPAVAATDPLAGRRVEIPLDGGARLLALALPGHTPGSYLYLYKGVLFAGDSLQIDGDHLELAMRPFSISPSENRANVARLEELLDGARVDIVCTGHQGCTPPGRGARMLSDLIARARSGP